MTADPADFANLANLADIVLTAPPSFWPPAPGVCIVAAAAGAALIVAVWRGVRRYQANAFLRDAARRLDEVASRTWTDDSRLEEAISAILKRAALVVYGRDRVASLTGAAWRDFLASTMPAGMSPPRLTVPEGASAACAQIAAARAWLRARRHERSGKPGKEG